MGYKNTKRGKTMVEIEDREMKFKSYKSHARFLKIEVHKLQQLLSGFEVKDCYYGAKKEFERGVK